MRLFEENNELAFQNQTNFRLRTNRGALKIR
jgi:hypothetical protein